MRVVLARQKNGQSNFAPKARPGKGAGSSTPKPAEKRARDLRLWLKPFKFLFSIWRSAQGNFARQSPWSAFVGWQAYYAPYLGGDAGHALLAHTGPYVGDPAQQIELINAITAGCGPTMVSAPPGCGKSRFALELAQRLEQEARRWQVLFVRHDEALVQEELPQLLQLKRVVLIVDDAHECPQIVGLLAAASAETPTTAPLHLVCLTRSAGRAQVSRAINGAFAPGLAREIDLGRPSPRVVRSLIEQLLPESSPHHRDTVARFVGQSHFGAVAVCGMLRREARLPQTFQRQDLRDRVCRELLREAADGLCPIDTALRALAVYAALAPVPKERADVRDWAAQLSGLVPEKVDVLLERALKAGLFAADGSALMRPTPDLLGDLLLEQACFDAQDRPTPFGTELLEQLLEVDPGAAARNCADIGQLFGTPEDGDLLSKLVLERAQAIPSANQWDVLELLQTIQPLATRRPATVVALAGMLEDRGILRRRSPVGELFSSNSIEMRTCELLMSAGEVDATALPVALGLARDLYVASREDTRSRKHLLEELRAYCRFETGRSLAHARAVADTLHGWVSEPDIAAAALCASLSAQFLALEVAARRDEEHAPAASRSALTAAPDVWSVRDVAMDTLTRGMAHDDAIVQCTAIGSLERYADYEVAPEQAWWERWSPQLARETERLAAALGKLAQETRALPVSAAAELQGWHWWVRQEDVLHRMGVATLRAIPDSDAYRLWKLLFAPQLPVRTALPESTPTQPEDRLQHVQAFATAREEDRAEQARQLYDSLNPRYPDSAAWRGLWLVVLEQSPGIALGQHASAVIAEFARRHPEVAWSVVNQTDADGPLRAVLPFLLMELGRLDRARRSQEARNVPAGTRLEEAWLRALSVASDLDEPELTILARGLESADSDAVHRAASALLTASGNDRSAAFLQVFRVIAHRATDSGLWELAIERFASWAEGVLPPRSGVPTDEVDGMARVADELMTLLQTEGSHLRWGFQRHTRQLARALAIVAVLRPRRMQQWMQRDWGQPAAPGGKWSDESPLSVGRLAEIMRLIAGSPVAAQWVAAFSDWIRRDPQLAGIGALGLAELCSLEDTRVSDLGRAIETNTTEASRKAFEEFVNQRKRRERPSSG